MAGPFWEPLSPSPPLCTRLLSPSLCLDLFCPLPLFLLLALSPQSPDTPTSPFSPLEGNSPCLAGLGCLDLLPTPRRRSFSTAPQGEGKAVVLGGGGEPYLTTGQGPHLKFPGARDTPEGTRALTQ